MSFLGKFGNLSGQMDQLGLNKFTGQSQAAQPAAPQQNPGYPAHQYNQPGALQQQQNPGYPAPQYNQPATPQQNSGYPPPQPNQQYAESYHPVPPQSPYPPAVTQNLPPGLPSGWTTLFDQRQQKWYYVNQATSYTQWEMPTYQSLQSPPPPPPPPPPSAPVNVQSPEQSRSAAAQTPDVQPVPAPVYQPAPVPAYQPAPTPTYQPAQPQALTKSDQPNNTAPGGKEKSGKAGMLGAAAGGLAVGAIGGAVVSKVFSNNRDDGGGYDGYGGGYGGDHGHHGYTNYGSDGDSD